MKWELRKISLMSSVWYLWSSVIHLTPSVGTQIAAQGLLSSKLPPQASLISRLLTCLGRGILVMSVNCKGILSYWPRFKFVVSLCLDKISSTQGYGLYSSFFQRARALGAENHLFLSLSLSSLPPFTSSIFGDHDY